MQHPRTILIRLRQLPRPDIDLERLMKKLGSWQVRIARLAQGHELILRDAVAQVFVLRAVVADRHVGHGAPALGRGVVVARPDLDVIWHAEQLAARLEEIPGAAAREIAACRAQVGVEEGVTAEYVVWLART